MWYMIPGKSPDMMYVRQKKIAALSYVPASNNPNKNLVTATVAKECTPEIPMVIMPQENIKNAIQVEGANLLSR
jgi:hypothetical protein